MKQTRILSGTRGLLADEYVGAGNVWERDGLEGLSAKIALEGRTEIIAVGSTFEVGGLEHKLVAIEFDGPTARYSLVIEGPDAPRPPSVFEDAPGQTGGTDEAIEDTEPIEDETPVEIESTIEDALPAPPNVRPVLEADSPLPMWRQQLARRYPEFTHAIPARSADQLREEFQALTPSILTALGRDIEVSSWQTSSKESYVDAGRGERLGPNTTSDFVAVLDPPQDARAEVSVNATRWSKILISDITVSGLWMIGDLDAWIRGTSEGDDQIDALVCRASDTITHLVLEALRSPQG